MAKRKTSASKPIGDRLLETAIDHFGRKGLDGASTREIAAAADTMMSSITYHYGGKEGLYHAAARHIAEQIRARLAPVVTAADEMPGSAAAAEALLLAIVDRFVEIMTHPDSDAWARFIVREQMEPTEAFNILFEFIGPVAELVSALIMNVSSGLCDLAEARLRVLAIIGQALVFRTSRAALMRLTGWSSVEADEITAIKRVVRAHTRAILKGSFEGGNT